MVAAPSHAANVTATFELEGNVATGASGFDDWATVNAPGSVLGIARTGVIADPAPQTVFAGGGSKDDLDLNGALSSAGGWKHKTGSVPDKDNLTNAYAVAYNVNNELIIYAGADRFDNSGNAFMGFWFFQNSIGLGSGGGGGGSPFTGQHAVGDVLVLANFINGGTTVNIEVLKWVGTGGNVNGTLQRIAGIAGGTPAKCGAAGTPDDFCGITNPAAGEAPPWAYLNKDGNQFFQAAGFLEIGINITKVFQAQGGATPCFTSFMAETRASSSIDATLKDFVLGGFEVCGINVTKQCTSGALNQGGTAIDYNIAGQVQNTGFGVLNSVTLVDNPVSGGFTYFACDAAGLPTGSPISFGGTLNGLQSVCYKSVFSTTTNGASDTITMTASTGTATLTDTASALCPNIPLSPSLQVAKTCSVLLDTVSPYLVVKVNVTGNVCNTGDVPLTNVVVTDTDISGNLLGTPKSLVVGACTDFLSNLFYYPASAENRINLGTSTLIPGLAKFSDTVTANADGALGTTVTPSIVTANCTLCPTCSPDVCTGSSCPQSSGAASGISTLLKKR